MSLQVLYEDNHLLAVAKPAGMLAQGDRSGAPSLVDAAKHYLKRKYAKPGEVYLGLVHRLDRNVSGLVLLARTSKAASRLSAQFRQGAVVKTYLAVCLGAPQLRQGTMRAWLGPRADGAGATPAAADPFPEAKEGVLQYEVLDRRGDLSLLKVVPLTGRRHQIRAQFALAGCPLLGDVKYGCPRALPGRRIALHSLSLEVAHPVGGAPLHLVCEPPVDWPWSVPDPLSRPG